MAFVLKQICEYRAANPAFHGTFHWSGNEQLTKYEMAKVRHH